MGLGRALEATPLPPKPVLISAEECFYPALAGPFAS